MRSYVKNKSTTYLFIYYLLFLVKLLTNVSIIFILYFMNLMLFSHIYMYNSLVCLTDTQIDLFMSYKSEQENVKKKIVKK